MTKKEEPLTRMTKKDKILWLNEHFAYEAEMLSYSIQNLYIRYQNPAVRSKIAKLFRYAMLETFLLHARNLLEFFYEPKQKKYPNDLRSQDFILKPHQNSYPLPKPSWYDDVMSRIGKQLAHLTKHRLYLPPEWYPDEIFSPLQKAILKFTSALPKDYIKKRLKDATADVAEAAKGTNPNLPHTSSKVS